MLVRRSDSIQLADLSQFLERKKKRRLRVGREQRIARRCYVATTEKASVPAYSLGRIEGEATTWAWLVRTREVKSHPEGEVALLASSRASYGTRDRTERVGEGWATRAMHRTYEKAHHSSIAELFSTNRNRAIKIKRQMQFLAKSRDEERENNRIIIINNR